MSHSVTGAIFSHWQWNKKDISAQTEQLIGDTSHLKKKKKKICELGKARFEEITFHRDKCALEEGLNNYEAFNFKGTQVHASRAGDWLIEALFALSGISIALCQVIEKEKEVFVWATLKKKPQLKALYHWTQHQSLPFFCSAVTLINPFLWLLCSPISWRFSQSISTGHRISSDRLAAATEERQGLNLSVGLDERQRVHNSSSLGSYIILEVLNRLMFHRPF